MSFDCFHMAFWGTTGGFHVRERSTSSLLLDGVFLFTSFDFLHHCYLILLLQLFKGQSGYFGFISVRLQGFQCWLIVIMDKNFCISGVSFRDISWRKFLYLGFPSSFCIHFLSFPLIFIAIFSFTIFIHLYKNKVKLYRVINTGGKIVSHSKLRMGHHEKF